MKWSTITQRLQNRWQRPHPDHQQRVAGFEARVRRWKNAPRPAAPTDTAQPPDARVEHKERRFRLPQGQRAERSLDQLYEEVGQQAVVSLAHFQNFLDAKELLLRARQADDASDDAGFPPAIGAMGAAEQAASPYTGGHDAAMTGGQSGGHDTDDGWDEDAQAGMWENGGGA
jgi:hypothetical protein